MMCVSKLKPAKKALRACGAAEALVLGCSAAVGRSGLVEQTFLAEVTVSWNLNASNFEDAAF